MQVWHVFALAALLGMVNAFDIPARQAFVVDMVGRDDLMNAIALNSSMFNGARIVGPAVAGALVGGHRRRLVLLAQRRQLRRGDQRAAADAPRRASRPRREGSGLANIVEGFRFVARTAPVRALLLLLGLVSLAGMPYSVLMPVFADQILHGGPKALGLLMGASGVGALAAAGVLATRDGIRGLGRWVALAAAGFGVSLMLFASSTTLWLSAAALVPVGFCMMLQMASSNTLIQSMVPDALRGRVMAVYSMMFMGMAPFGALLAGHACGAHRRAGHRRGRRRRLRRRRGRLRLAAAGAPARSAADHHRPAGCGRGAVSGHDRRRGPERSVRINLRPITESGNVLRAP